MTEYCLKDTLYDAFKNANLNIVNNLIEQHSLEVILNSLNELRNAIGCQKADDTTRQEYEHFCREWNRIDHDEDEWFDYISWIEQINRQESEEYESFVRQIIEIQNCVK